MSKVTFHNYNHLVIHHPSTIYVKSHDKGTYAYMYEANNIIIWVHYLSLYKPSVALRVHVTKKIAYLTRCVKNEKMINVQFELQSNDTAAACHMVFSWMAIWASCARRNA